MAHETRIKVKRDGKWVDAEELPHIREAEAEAHRTEPPAVDVNALPAVSALDEDEPFNQLFFDHPEIRAYVTEDGQIRRGLTPNQRKTAEAILKRYGGQL